MGEPDESAETREQGLADLIDSDLHWARIQRANLILHNEGGMQRMKSLAADRDRLDR